MDAETAIRRFVEDSLIVTVDEPITDDDNIFERGFVDSLFALQLVTFIEGEFAVTIADDDLRRENFQSIRAILSFVRSKLETAA
jgi:methoxymalonate biosynthesis acyl carrier protein